MRQFYHRIVFGLCRRLPRLHNPQCLYNSLMRRGRWLALIAVLVVLVGAGVGLWSTSPRLLSVTPAAGSRNVPLDAALELVFSQPVDPLSAELKIQPVVPGS